MGTTWGIAREAGLVAGVRARSSDAAWRTVVAGVAAVCGLLGMGAGLVSVSLMRMFPQIAETLTDLDGGIIGSLGLTLVGILSLPTLAIWAMALVVGPGFQLGSIGGLSAFGGEVGTLPALPVLAAIPTTVPGWAPMLLVVPVALGVLAGRIRWGRDLPTLAGALASGAGIGAVVGGLVAGLVLLASGSLGGGRLAAVGPEALPASASAAALVVLGFLSEAGFQSLRLSWDLHKAQQRAVATLDGDGAVGQAAAEVRGSAGVRDAAGVGDVAGMGAGAGVRADSGAVDLADSGASALNWRAWSNDANGTADRAGLDGMAGLDRLDGLDAAGGAGSGSAAGSGSLVSSSRQRVIAWVGAAGVFVTDTVTSVTGGRAGGEGDPGGSSQSEDPAASPDSDERPDRLVPALPTDSEGPRGSRGPDSPRDAPDLHDPAPPRDPPGPGDTGGPDAPVGAPDLHVGAGTTDSDELPGAAPPEPAEIAVSVVEQPDVVDVAESSGATDAAGSGVLDDPVAADGPRALFHPEAAAEQPAFGVAGLRDAASSSGPVDPDDTAEIPTIVGPH